MDNEETLRDHGADGHPNPTRECKILDGFTSGSTEAENERLGTRGLLSRLKSFSSLTLQSSIKVATISPMARLAVSPGDSIPKRLTMPGKP